MAKQDKRTNNTMAKQDKSTNNTMAKQDKSTNNTMAKQDKSTNNTMAKQDKRTNNNLPNTTQTIKDRSTRTPLKTEGKLGCPGIVSSSCSTSGTRFFLRI
jgi:hypothetical protein